MGLASRLSSLAALAALLTSCSWFENNLQRVKAAGELVVLTYRGQTTYIEGPVGGPTGIEYDMAEAFAERLGVRLKMVVVERRTDILPKLLKGAGDMAAAGLTKRDGEGMSVRFTPPYQEVRQQVVYRLGSPWPQSVEQLLGREIEIPSDSRHVRRLTEIKRQHPDLRWSAVDDRTSEQLLEMVWGGLLDITIADSHLIAINRQYFPELQLAFNLDGPEGLAWAFPDEHDDSLYQAAVQFLETQRRNGALAQLLDHYYGPASQANFINLTVYQLRIQNRLPQYQKSFEKVAKHHKLDWRLLAALGYQESYWDPRAVSPTGVRGMMMLTEETALRLGVKDRNDVEQSIEGGARYLREMYDRLPDTITGPDRMWMALAAYNVGLYHLEDARVITHMQKGNPNRWSDVKQRLPLLEHPQWAEYIKYGPARGREPVLFVNRVRTYYDVLVKLDEEEKERRNTEALKIKVPAI
jgi:membrane-bound lytic murein transglycosylase F